MTHKIKLQQQFCEAVYLGNKPYEIRFNDRDYKKGDKVVFIPVDDKAVTKVNHPVSECVYEITCVTSGWGLKHGWVVLGIKKVNELRGDNDEG